MIKNLKEVVNMELPVYTVSEWNSLINDLNKQYKDLENEYTIINEKREKIAIHLKVNNFEAKPIADKLDEKLKQLENEMKDVLNAIKQSESLLNETIEKDKIAKNKVTGEKLEILVIAHEKQAKNLDNSIICMMDCLKNWLDSKKEMVKYGYNDNNKFEMILSNAIHYHFLNTDLSKYHISERMFGEDKIFKYVRSNHRRTIIDGDIAIKDGMNMAKNLKGESVIPFNPDDFK